MAGCVRWMRCMSIGRKDDQRIIQIILDGKMEHGLTPLGNFEFR